MGDFQDVFGAGADALDIIDGYSREYERSSRSEKASWNGAASRAGVKEQSDDLSWAVATEAKGYAQGPQFSSYEELSAWGRSNTRQHVRSRSGQAFQVYFVDFRLRLTHFSIWP
jgi:hypothetical protein